MDFLKAIFLFFKCQMFIFEVRPIESSFSSVTPISQIVLVDN